MLPTPIPPSASELAIPKVEFKGRLVSGKKSNSPFLAYQRYKASQNRNQHRPENTDAHLGQEHHDHLVDTQKNSKQVQQKPVVVMNPLLASGFRYSLLILLFSLLLSRMITENWLWGYDGKYIQWKYYFPGKQEVFTIESLSEYDGIKDPSKPLLLAINGVVYNVDSSRSMYGPGSSYHHFVGKDASRAFVTGCFKSGLTYDLRGLNDKQKKSMNYWIQFYENSSKYSRVGRIELPKLTENDPIPKDCDPKKEGGSM